MKEQNSRNEEVHRRKGIYLLPNLLTTAGLFSGFYAIVAAMNNRFEPAAVAIIIAIILDGLDGRVARLTNTSSEFGAQYDSLSDMACFGIAPALVVYEWSLTHMTRLGWANLGWLAAFFYAATAALRLARFNATQQTSNKQYFMGLASPAAAGVLATMVWTGDDLGYQGSELVLPAFFVTIAVGALMVSNVKYASFKDVDFRKRVPFMVIIMVVLAFMLLNTDPPKVLLGAALIYTLSGPVYSLWLFVRKRRAA